jgi:hypothetical protein
MTKNRIRRSYTSTIPLMVVGLAMNTSSLVSSETTDSVVKSIEDHSKITCGRVMLDKELIERIEDYTENNYSFKSENTQGVGNTSDLLFFTMTQEFIGEQVDLDDDFMDVLNLVTQNVGKIEPTRSRL